MDTRTKILSETVALETLEALRAQGESVRAVTGFFDVLLAAHVRALRDFAEGKSKLIALVLNPPEPLLAQDARAELAASLATVDYVVAVADDGAELLRGIQPARVLRMEADDAHRRRELIEHVQRRRGA